MHTTRTTGKGGKGSTTDSPPQLARHAPTQPVSTLRTTPTFTNARKVHTAATTRPRLLKFTA